MDTGVSEHDVVRHVIAHQQEVLIRHCLPRPLRERRRAAKRLGLPEQTALKRYDPWEEPAR